MFRYCGVHCAKHLGGFEHTALELELMSSVVQPCNIKENVVSKYTHAQSKCSMHKGMELKQLG